MGGKLTERILSQDEVDALFSSVGEKRNTVFTQNAVAPTNKKVIKYDIRKPDRLSKEQVRSLHLIHTNFQRSFSSSLSAYLRAFVELKLLSIDQIIYSEFLEYISEPTCYNSINMSPLEGNMVMEIGYSVVFPMIDLLLGGAGLPPREGRLITDIEWSIIDGVVKLALNDLKKAWTPVVELDMTVVAHESKPQLLQFVSLSESLVAVVFELRIGNNSGTMNIGIPSIMLKLLGKRFEQQQWVMRRKEDVARDLERIRNLLPGIPVDMRVEIGGNLMSVRDFVDLKVGDVIGLGQRVDKPVVASVEGVPRYQGHVVRFQERRGIVIEDQASELELYQ